MAATSPTKLTKMIRKSLEERAAHLKAAAEIEAVFTSLGLSIAEAEKAAGSRPTKVGKVDRRVGRRPKRGRGSYDQTAEEFVLSLLKGKSLLTAQVNNAWREAGRKGVANNTLTKLVKLKQLK